MNLALLLAGLSYRESVAVGLVVGGLLFVVLVVWIARVTR